MFKKVLAVTMAATMVLGMTAVASAEKEITDATGSDVCVVDGGNFQLDVLAAGVDPTTVYGMTFTLSVDEDGLAANGLGGGIGFNGPSDVACGWDQSDWGNEGAEKANTLVKVSDGVYTITRQESEAKLNAEEGSQGSWAQVWLSCWWGDDFSVTAVDLLGADGSVIYSTNAAATTEDASNTGAVAPVVVVALVGAASAAVVVSKKRA